MCKEISSTRKINIGPSGLINAAIFARKKFSDFGISFARVNRLDRAKTMIEDVNNKRRILTPDDEELLNLVTEAQWTIIEHFLIAKALGKPNQALSPILFRKIVEILSGADLPEIESNPQARNTQFELYVAAMFAMGGVPISIAEPDLVFNYLGMMCGLAAKRVSSFRKATRRAEEAADQISASGIIGVVAINMDLLLKKSSTQPSIESTLAERLDIVSEIEKNMANREKVIATMTFGKDCIWDFLEERPHASISHFIRFIVHPKTPEEEIKGNDFFNRVKSMIDERIQFL